MDFLGLVGSYPVNRRLTEEEINIRLKQEHRLGLVPRYQLCVIKMNGTYLDSVDKWFA